MLKKYASVYFKGMAMGAADIVPGVSGGTVAFITGIYDELIQSIRKLASYKTLDCIFKRQFLEAFLHANGQFLACVFFGVLTAVFLMSGIIVHLMAQYPIQMGALFFGLISASIWILIAHVLKNYQKHWGLFVYLAIGVVFAYGLGQLQAIHLEVNWLVFFAGGFIAICAMILPGISGSFLLLIFGLYKPLLLAVQELNVLYLFAFATGCGIGLLCFSHLLAYMLSRFPAQSHVFLIGLLIGSLDKIWPWKEVVEYRVNSQGESVPLFEQNVSPWVYESVVQLPAHILPALSCAILAFLCILALDRISMSNQNNETFDQK